MYLEKKKWSAKQERKENSFKIQRPLKDTMNTCQLNAIKDTKNTFNQMEEKEPSTKEEIAITYNNYFKQKRRRK